MSLSPFGKPELPYEITVYVPSTEFQKPIPKELFNKRIRETWKKMHKTFGGTTRVVGIGSFTSKKRGILVQEDVMKVTSFAEKKTIIEKMHKFNKWLLKIKNKWKQEELSVEYENDLHFVK